MTSLASTVPRTARRVDPLVAALLATAIAGLVALWVGAAALGGPASDPAPRIALVVDAGARPDVALAQARAAASRTERSGPASVSVRVPRTAAEAATDVRYFSAQGFDRVVAVGPLAADATRAAAGGGPQVVTADAVPRTLR